MRCRRSSSLSCALLAVLLASCGGTEGPPATSTAPRPARSSAAAATYVPAGQTCSAMPGPAVVQGPVASTSKHISGYVVCGSFTAPAGRSSFSCPLPAGAVGPYRLLLYNGNPDGTARAESATIRVNGRPVLDHDDFDEKVSAATAQVVLAASNTIDVRIEERRAQVRFEIVDEGQTCSILGPSLVSEANSPFATSFPSKNAFPVPELQLFNGFPAGMRKVEKGSVSLNGATVLPRKQFHEQMSAFLASVSVAGTNKLVAVAGEVQGRDKDKKERRGEKVRRQYAVQIVDRDKTPPSFSIASRGDGSYTNRPQLVLSGPIDDSSAQVSIGSALGSIASGRYSAQATLRECWNTITVHAADVCGNSSEAFVRVGLDTVPPVLAIVSPASGLVTNQPQQPVTLRYSDNFSGFDPSSVLLLLDGTDITTTLAVAGDAATGTLNLPEGRHLLHAEVRDRAGNATTQEAALLIDLTPPALAIVAPKDGSTSSQSPIAIDVSYADPLSGVDPTSFAASVDGKDVTRVFAVGSMSATARLPVPPGRHDLEVRIADRAGNVAIARSSFSVSTLLPPDPKTVAPALDRTVATTLADATSFLYTGPNPIQTGVAPGTIEPRRASVLRGSVHSRAGDPLPGATVTVLGHAEFGATLTRDDGRYDLAVNGGGPLLVKVHAAGYLDAQRSAEPAWGDYALVPDLVLVALDPVATPIDLGGNIDTQVGRGTVSQDGLGPRQATVLFPPGTSATMELPDGTTRPLPLMHFRATEYTVGETGPRAMPAPLPPASAYTYAVAFTADEAVALNATAVRFSQPVFAYVENFLQIPVGKIVPAGYYDPQRGVWVPSSNGVVLRILSVTNGLADIDADGDGIADTAAQLAARGLSASERARLASLYLPGQSLWRVPLQHFSSDDFNFSGTAPFGAHPADTPKPTEPKAVQGPVQCPGSIVEVENQVLGERLDLPGTPCSLNYRSDRVRGRHANHRLDVPIPAQFDITLPPNVICDPSATPACQRQSSPRFTVTPTVTVSIAGRSFSNTASAAPAVWKFEWDGLDAYGRRLQGEHPITIQACNNYPLVDYFDPDTDLQALANSFGSVSASNQVMLRRLTGFTYGTYGFTGGVSLCSSWQGKLGGWDAQPQGLGGWTLSAQHSYDPTSATLYFGNGEHQTAHDLNQLVMNPFAGKPEESWLTNLATAVMVAPDGSLYFSDFSQVFKIAVDGTRTVIAGRIIPPYPIGDEGPATDAYLLYPSGLALGPEGSLYIMDTGNNRIRRVTPDGIIHTVAGTGVDESAQAFTADGVLAVNASLQLGATGYQEGIVVTPDGALIFSETTANRVRKIGPDGILRTVAGTGSAGFGGDGGPALQGSLNSPAGLALAKDGTLYIADAYNFRVRKVTPSGIISTVLTNPCGYNFVCSNYVRNEPILALAIAPDDTLFVGNGVRGLERVRPDGSHSRVAGNNTATTCTGKDCPALSILFWPRGVALAPDGSLFLSSDSYTPARVVRVSGSVAAATAADTAVASRDGSEVYQFDGQGRHVRTVDALTGVVKDRFAYGSTGLLASVTDESGNVTTVERDGQGNATAIVGPYGQRTSLALDSNGYLASVVNPAGEAVYLQSTGDGLLTQLTDPRGGVHTFQHDVDGFLLKDQDPAGGFQSFDRHGQLDAASVTRQTALGRTSNDQTTLAPAGDAEARMATDAALLSSTTKRNPDYSQSEAGPDGTVASLQLSPDPRFGMDAPLTGVASVRTPGGLTLATTTTRTVSLLDTNNPLNFASLTTSVATNGQAFSSTYDRASSTVTSTTPAGRRAVTTLDALGRVAQVQAPGVLPVRVQYDSRGRPFSVTQGSRVVSYVYDAQGNLASLTDPLGRQVSFAYDLAGRPTRQVLPDGRTISLAYDASGNVTSVTPPGRPAHSFAYTPVDLEQSYSPPNLGFQSTTQTSYDLDRQVTLVSRPAGDSIVPSYDTAGRLASLTTSAGATRVTYDPTSGHLAQLTAPGGVGLTYVYDGALLTDTSWAGPISGTLHRSYDNFFRVATESVSGGQPISYHYDPDGLLTSAGALQIQRDPATGFVTGSSLGGITEARAYDAYGAEASYTASAGSSSLYSVTYTRDALGRIASKTERVGADAAHTFSYGYDLAGRLSDVAKDGTPTAHYTYDANGNRTAGPGLTASPVYDAQDRMLAYGACSYTYKASGELQTKTCPDGTTTYDYDALGNLRHVALPNQTQIDYVVDGQNRRIGKKVNGVLVEGFLYRNQLQPSAWLDATGAVKATFAYGLHANVPEYMVQGTTTYRLITDKVGSVRLIVDTSTGAVAERVDYDEFGSVLADSAPGMQPFGFAGGIRDHDTGLVRFGARDYCPITGRWTNKEPLGFNGSLNFYQYVDGDPVNVKDPTGLAKVGDVVFFNWYGQKFPEHAAIVTDVDGAGNPTHAFGGWEDTMTFHDVDLSSYKLGITDNIIGTGDMTGLHSLSLSDFEAAWDGTAVAPDWDGTRGNVCIDATTGKGSYGGAILRSAMAADFNKHPKSYKNYGAGNADPRSRFFYRRNPWLWQFFKNTGRLH